MTLHPNTSSLPPNFFSTLPPPSPRQPTLRTALQSALLPCTLHKWICDFLFVDPAPFHPHIPLPPELFHTSLCMSISHTFLDTVFTPQTALHTTDASLLFVPVASIPPNTVGYAFSHADKQPTIIGRFFFDSNSHHLIMVLPRAPASVSPVPVTVIMTVSRCLNTRAHTFFAVPPLQYSYEHMPNHVYSMCVAEAASEDIQTQLDDLFARESLNMVNTLLQDLPPPSPTLANSLIHTFQHGGAEAEKTISSPFTEGGDMADGMHKARYGGARETASGIFETNRLKQVLKSMELALEGSFYASRPRRSGGGGFRNVVARLNVCEGRELKQIALQNYLATAGVDRELGKEEMKKRRNRLSAMKSNERRKVMWQGKKLELQRLKERQSELRARLKVVEGENERLKQLLQGEGAV